MTPKYLHNLFVIYIKLTNMWQGVLTGKSVRFGGSAGRTGATGYGAIYFLKEMLHAHDETMEGKSVIVSGAGNVALHAAEKAMAEGAKVLTVSDSGGTLYFPEGMSEEQLLMLQRVKIEEYGRLSEVREGTYLKGQRPWGIKADIALPCATQNEVDEHAAQTMVDNGVMAIAEGANMPLNSAAQHVVINNNVLYGPGKAANAGGVAVSGLERTQNAVMQSWSLERVDNELQALMKRIHERCIKHVEKENGRFPYRKGANIYSFKKLADTLLAYGLK